MKITTSKITIDDGRYVKIEKGWNGGEFENYKQRKIKLVVIDGQYYQLSNKRNCKGFNSNVGMFNTGI